MKDSVLVTGAGGFVGSAVVRLLVGSLDRAPPRFSDGSPMRRVIAVLRSGGSRERLEVLRRSAMWSIAEADVTDRSALRSLLKATRPRAIFHAALDKATHRDLTEAEMVRMIDAPLHVLFEGIAGVPGGRLIHTGSARVLGAGHRLAEDAALAPSSAYARSKVRAERLLPKLGRQTSVDWINLRLFNLFGPYESRTRLLPYLVSRLSEGLPADLSHGRQIRDFSEVEDIAGAYLLALSANERACGRTYHIGSGRGMTVRDFAGTIAEVTGNAELLRFGAGQTSDHDLVADPGAARRDLGWAPPDNAKERIGQAAEWWRDRIGARSRASL